MNKKSVVKIILLFCVSFFAISDVALAEIPLPVQWQQILVNNSGQEVIVVTTNGYSKMGRPYVLKNGQSIIFYYSEHQFPIHLSDLKIVVIMNNIVVPDNLGDRNPQYERNYVEYPSDDKYSNGKLIYTFTESDYQYALNYGKK